jgi:hyaluronoglucosaminidase
MSQSPFHIRGVVEGFYGVYYTFPERNDLIHFIGQHGFNFYIYGPKNDRQHRMRWREPYPSEVMDQFAETAALARDAGVTFCYSISPGVSICYSAEAEFQALTAKLHAFYQIGVRAFSILLDDIAVEFQHAADRQRYRTYAEAHVDLCNRLWAWLQELDPACSLSMCPTDYHGTAPFSDYLHELGEGLHPAIDIFYTGRGICSPTISTAEARAFAEVARRPPLIWDNYPVNDLRMQAELHIGPIRGRDEMLFQSVGGVLVNPMNQAEASKIPLLTFADYFADPQNYDPQRSWEKALRAVAGEESFEAVRTLAENSLHSSLGAAEAERLERLTIEALAALRQGESPSGSPAVAALDSYLTSIDEACYHLKNRMHNLALRNNLLPWIELLEHWHWMAKSALQVLRAREHGERYGQPLSEMQEWLEAAQRHHKRIAGKVLLPLAEYILERV